MLKKILILFLSANLCAAENPRKSELSTKSYNSSIKAIGLGLATLFVYTIMPKLLGDSNDSRCFTTLAGAAVGAYGLTQLYAIGVEINENMNPSEAKKASDAEAHKRYQILTKKQEFRSCLMDNVSKLRNASGIPTECEKLACMYEITAGKSALDEMTATFKKVYRN